MLSFILCLLAPFKFSLFFSVTDFVSRVVVYFFPFLDVCYLATMGILFPFLPKLYLKITAQPEELISFVHRICVKLQDA